jgi:acyl-CoA synthetase (AMP-forming)/AMP-acid ligase II
MDPGRAQENLAALLVDRAERHPLHPFGMAGAPFDLAEAMALAARVAATLGDLGVGPGDRVALIGSTSSSYLLTWVGLQLAGAEVALLNPTYPGSLLAEMARTLDPEVVLWSDRLVERAVAPAAQHLDVSGVAVDSILVDGEPVTVATTPGDLPGLGRRPWDVAGWMHTSGTTGVPKLCTQTHEYFLRLGRFVADSLALTERDTVLAPLPMFHVNPLGYGVVGGLVGHAAVLGWERFSARGFWPLVRDAGVTVAILHAPPVEILKRATTSRDAAGHRLRGVLFADEEFLERFDVPLGLSVYGSTEVGGLSHSWTWRRGERTELPEGMSRYGGRSRSDLRWTVATDGEILVAADRPGVLFSGYLRDDGLDPAISGDGWFHTGDTGRIDGAGNLVFVERAAEAIRVKGEYVPIAFVEEQFRDIHGIDDLALWRRDSELVDHESVLFITADSTPTESLRAAAARIPAYMRPRAVLRVEGPLPRDTGVGKVRRRELGSLPVIEESPL